MMMFISFFYYCLVSDPPCPVKPRPVTSTTRNIKKSTPRRTTPAASSSRPTPAAPVSTTSSSHSKINRQVPPPPPPPPASESVATTPSLPTYKAIYPFHSEQEGEISFEIDDILEIVEKDENGK